MARPLRMIRRQPRRLRGLADEELMELIAGNDPDAFEVVLERHADAAVSLAYRMVGVRSLAEDIVQEAFLSVWTSGNRYDPARGGVRAWTLGIVHHRAVDYLRRDGARALRQIGDEGLAERLEAPERTEIQVAQRSSTREIRSALGQLPEDQARVIELAYFGGFTHTEIASMLELPIGTVKGRMRLALEKLRDHFGDRELIA
jgi:RNA polymerase sigma-70 factor, ECF subfamily